MCTRKMDHSCHHGDLPDRGQHPPYQPPHSCFQVSRSKPCRDAGIEQIPLLVLDPYRLEIVRSSILQTEIYAGREMVWRSEYRLGIISLDWYLNLRASIKGQHSTAKPCRRIDVNTGI